MDCSIGALIEGKTHDIVITPDNGHARYRLLYARQPIIHAVRLKHDEQVFGKIIGSNSYDIECLTAFEQTFCGVERSNVDSLHPSCPANIRMVTQ